jgi:hypothetical protein
MGNQAKLRPVAISLRLNEQYFIGRMLMRRERLTRAQWDVFAATADTICDGVLDQVPVDHPESAVWDNRHKRPPVADRSSRSSPGRP